MNTSTHNFSEIYIHLVWHCHENKPMIKENIEPELFKFITEYCRGVKGVYFKRIGGTQTHIHLALRVEPYVLLSELTGNLKGASSREINKRYGKDTLHWQRGYGAVSFAGKNLDAVVKYIDNQKEHHRKKTINEVLERIAAENKD